MEGDITADGVCPCFGQALGGEDMGDVGELVEEVKTYGAEGPLLCLAHAGGEGGVPHPFGGVHTGLTVAAAEIEAQVGVEVDGPFVLAHGGEEGRGEGEGVVLVVVAEGLEGGAGGVYVVPGDAAVELHAHLVEVVREADVGA